MKIAYRIVTPILAIGSIAMGIFLKMFNFVIGNADSQINNLIGAVAQLSGGKIKQVYEYSVFELIKMLGTTPAADKAVEDAKPITEVLAPIMPQLVAFFVIIAFVAIVFIAIAVLGIKANDKKSRNNVIITSVVGLVLLFICIIITNSAFSAIIDGKISLTDLITTVMGSSLAALATAIVSVTSATLSAGFYAMFGMFILIIIWTVVANMVIAQPIQTRRVYKRKKPIKKLSAITEGVKGGKKKKSKEKKPEKTDVKAEEKPQAEVSGDSAPATV